MSKPTQWFKNGDHPNDNSRDIQGGDGYFLSEGKVVRRYRNPNIKGDSECIFRECEYTMHDHGWIDQGEGGLTICPGDYIYGEEGYYKVKPKSLMELDEKIKGEKPMHHEHAHELDVVISECEVKYQVLLPNVMCCSIEHKGAACGFTGMASSLVPEEYDTEAAKRHAYNDAKGKVQQMENYRRSMNKFRSGERVRDIGYAVGSVKSGMVAARKGWNGSDMFVFYVPAGVYPAARNGKGTLLGQFPDDMVPYGAYLAIKNSDGKVVPWAPSGSDALAEDWYAWELTCTKAKPAPAADWID